MFFLFLYFTENFLINFLDLVVVRSVFSEYYHDDMFLDSFSFRTFQFVLTALVAFMVSQMASPSITGIKKNPEIISFLFQSSCVLHLMMLACFLYELTYEKADIRARIFKSEISKVLF